MTPGASCSVCGERFDEHDPAEGTAPDATPDAGSLLLCGGCGVLYRLDETLRPKRVEVVDLAIDPTQKREILFEQARLRERAARMPPPAYVAGIRRAQAAAIRWLDQNPHGELPRLRMADDSILVIAPLDALSARVAGNDRARGLIAHLLRREPDLTVFMLRVAATALGLPIEAVSLSELGLSLGQA